MGIAATMAGMLGLHREETYCLPPDARPSEVVEMESKRRTLWMIDSQANLLSGSGSPVPFSLDDITALMPCEESDFAFGIVPTERAALFGTQAAHDHPEMVSSPSRSLFAAQLQAHSLWGSVARRACLNGKVAETNETHPPWDERSEFAELRTTLMKWEDGLSPRHRWSEWNLRVHKAESLDLVSCALKNIESENV